MKSTDRTADLLFILSLRLRLRKNSLRRAARAELLKSRSKSARFGDRLSFVRPVWHNDLLFLIALLFIAIVVLTLPLSSLELRRLSAPEDAEGFLRSLWQVVAVALALSVAVILFLFQAVATSQPGGSLREFAEDSHLLKFLDLGVVALLMLGLTLLGVGSGAPGGWAATWASFFAGAAIVFLPVLFRSALHAVSDKRLHTRRLARLRKRAEQSVEIDAHTGIAYQLLDEFCSTEGIELEPVFATPPDGSKRLTSWRPGQIGDVNLRLLRALAKEVKAGGSVTLTVYPGSMVGVDGLLGYFSTPTTTAPFRLAPRLFRIGPRHRDEIVEAIEQVHNEALKAIGNSDPLSFERTTAIYREIISAFADSWYRHRKTISHPRSGFGLVEGPTRRLTRKLYEELHLAMRSESREIMFEATSLPISISTIGIERRNVDLARQAFRLAIEMYRLVKRLPATEISEIGLERSWLLLLEHIEYKIAFPISDGDTSPDEKGHLLPFAHLGFRYIAELLKIMVDHEDLSTVRQVDARWVDFFKHWFPEQARPRDFDVTALEDQHGADDHRVMAARDQAENNKLLAEQKQALLGTRDHLHFSLAFWALHRLRRTAEKETLAGIFRHFISHLGTLRSVVAITDAVLTTEWEGGFSQPWTNWLLGELPPGKAGFVGADPKIMQTFLLATLMKINPESEPPGIQPHDWIRSRLEELLSLLDHLVADSELWQALPEVSDVPNRGDRLAQSLKAAARAQQTIEDEVIRAGTVDSTKISELTQAIHKGLADHQWIPALFRRDGQLRTPSSEAPEDEEWFGATQWIPKEMLVAESRFVGIDMFGENFGRAIADGEANSLVEALAQSPRLEIGSGTAREQLDSAIQAVRAEGRRPSAILIPLDWRIEDELGLVTAFGSTEAPDWMPQAVKHAFHGSIEDISVFSWQSVKKGRVHLVDIASFGTWTQWRVNAQGETIKIDIEDHSPEEALHLTTAHDDLFRKPEAQSPEERANELRKYLHLSVHERFTLEVLDIAAARWIEVSES